MFWLDYPLILFKKDKILQLWPLSNLSMVEKLNAISRFIILLSVLGYCITKKYSILMIGVLALLGIIVLHKKSKKSLKESFSKKDDFFKIKGDTFTQPTKENPLMNVLLPEIVDKPNRPKAAPAYEPPIEKAINNSVMDPRFFLDLGDNLSFDRSMRQFYTMPNTKVPNDQKSFGEFCYGNMPSCKEGSEFQCEKNQARPRIY